MRKIASGLAIAILVTLVTQGTAHATTPTLPATTSWVGAGLQEMVRISGPITVSVDGAGVKITNGTLQVNKPANATVIAAYLTSSTDHAVSFVPGVTLNGSAVTFSHTATTAAGAVEEFSNFFSDVTSIVKPVVDAAASGVIDIPFVEGANEEKNHGQSLVVIFDDPAKPQSSVILMFGTSAVAGDAFTFSFPAISDLSRQIPTLSLGISYSYQLYNRNQQSDIKLSTSSNSNLRTVSVTAGGADDGVYAPDGDPIHALITVGGVGDSATLPGLTAADDDDELYGLSSFLAVGDTSLTINTRNQSADDNLFLSVLQFEGVAVSGATTVGSAPTVFVAPAATADTTAPVITSGSTTPKVTTQATAVETYKANETVTWAIVGGTNRSLFALNTSTGALTVKNKPTPPGTYTVQIQATDSAGNKGAVTTVTITVSAALATTGTSLSPWAPALVLGGGWMLVAYSRSLRASRARLLKI